MSYIPVVVCIPPTDPDAVEDAVDQALAPFADFVDEQWYERPNWREDLDPRFDGATPDAVAAHLADSTGNEWRHEAGPDGPRFFELTGDNPQGQWSSYEVGGRFPGLFRVAAGADPVDRALVRGAHCPAGRTNGGPLRLLDLDAARREAQLLAAERYVQWCTISAEAPGVRALADIAAELGVPAGRPISSAAAAAFEAQPQVELARARELVGSDQDPVAVFASPDRLFEDAGLRAVTGGALVTLGGDWIGDPSGYYLPGPRGEESLNFHREANAYLDSLDRDFLVILASLRR